MITDWQTSGHQSYCAHPSHPLGEPCAAEPTPSGPVRVIEDTRDWPGDGPHPDYWEYAPWSAQIN